jgi:hypothetical protein
MGIESRGFEMTDLLKWIVGGVYIVFTLIALMILVIIFYLLVRGLIEGRI